MPEAQTRVFAEAVYLYRDTYEAKTEKRLVGMLPLAVETPPPPTSDPAAAP